jgi:hypothetical protein
LVIGEVLSELGIPEDKFAATCVLVDKLEKVSFFANDEAEYNWNAFWTTNNRSDCLVGLIGLYSRRIGRIRFVT